MECLNQEPVLFEDILCQMHDMLAPEKEGTFTLRDLKRHRPLAGIFFNALFNLHKFIAFETRDPFTIRQVSLPEDAWGHLSTSPAVVKPACLAVDIHYSKMLLFPDLERYLCRSGKSYDVLLNGQTLSSLASGSFLRTQAVLTSRILVECA